MSRKTANEETPAESGKRRALPVALLVLAAYFVSGIVGGGVELGWWS